jgi:tetratricopeptide (TPR) repeat protein
MGDEVQKAEAGARKAWPVVMSWVGGISAIIGLLVTLGGGVTWFTSHQKQRTELKNKIALAQGQAAKGEYQASVNSYFDILKDNPLYQPALDGQLSSAMLWVENFHITLPEGQNPAEVAGPALDQILMILDAGLTRTKGSETADIRAHIGWAHWLNQHIAEREFGSDAEQNLRAALASDPSNVYANSMFGDWLLLNGGSVSEAAQDFNTAVATGKVRPFVRALQLGGFVDLDRAGARAQVIRAANEMRQAGEPLDETKKKRVLTFCFEPIVTDHEELVESLSAVPKDEAWKTYLWLDDQPAEGRDAADQQAMRDFIDANLLEISGDRENALRKYRAVQQEMSPFADSLKSAVGAAIKRLAGK